jgi:hypothetical protein
LSVNRANQEFTRTYRTFGVYKNKSMVVGIDQEESDQIS